MTRLGQMIYDDGVEEGMSKGIQAIVKMCEEFGIEKEETMRKISEKFEKTMEEAQEEVNRYWD